MEWMVGRTRRGVSLIARRRSARLAAGILAAALLLAAWAAPAKSAADGRLTLTLSSRWNLPPRPGVWAPYAVKVRNDGTATFNGEVRLVPNPPGQFAAFQSVPQYRAPVTVAGGTERELSIYVLEPPGGYHAELRDELGGAVTRAALQSAPSATAAVAILSDTRQVDQRIDAPLKALSATGVALSQFPSPQSFPTNAVYLSGLNGLIVDQLSSAALTPSQLQTLEDFVGLGGALILVGGSSWRRAMLPLPAELLPLLPTATASASLLPLADLAGLTTSPAAVQVATGEVASWARVALASPEGQPLIVEGRHGAGHIVALTFDPLVPPLDSQLDLAALSWSQAISRALSGAQAGSPNVFAGPPSPGVLRGSGPGSWSPAPGSLQQALSGFAPSPPFGLLALLLVGYGLIVTLLSYAVLIRAGRRGLLWVTAPAIAIAFTAGTYWVGFGSRGSDFQASAIQTVRLGPGGVAEIYSFDAILAPRRGDVRLASQPDSLVSTAVASFGPGSSVGGEAMITVGSRPEVLLANVPVWDVRSVETLGVARPFSTAPGRAMPIDAALRLSQGRVTGEVANHTARSIRDVQLVTASGTRSQLLRSLAPGATAAVDVALPTGPPGLAAKGGVVFNGAMPPQSAGQGLPALAASQAAGRPGALALVAGTDPIETLRVEGRPPAGSTRAMLVEPVVLRSADSLSGIAPQARLVSSYTGGSGQVDAYEVDLPPGLAGRVGITSAPMYGPQPITSAEVYDWDLGTWRTVALQPQMGYGQTLPAAPLATGEISGGVVRIRVHPQGHIPIFLSATSLP